MTRDREARKNTLSVVDRGAIGSAEYRRRLHEAAAPGMRAVRDRFGEILERLRAGESVRHCCAAMKIHREHLKRLVRGDSALRARYRAALIQGKPHRPAFYAVAVRPQRSRFYSVKGKSLQHAEEVVALVATGMSLHAACCSSPDFPTRRQMLARLRRDADLNQKYLAGSKHLRAPPLVLTTTMIDAVIADVAGGSLLRDACARRGTRVSAFQFRVSQDPVRRAEWAAAREKSGKARFARGTLRHADAILALLESGRTVTAALASNPDYPQSRTFRNALDTDAALRARYDAAVARTTVDRFVAIRRRTFVPAPAVIKSRTMPPPGEHLATSLSSNELWRAAIAALPKHLDDPDLRNDVAGDIVVAVLSGDLSPHRIASEAHRFIRAHARRFSQFEFASLDKSIGFDSTITLGDTLVTDPSWE